MVSSLYCRRCHTNGHTATHCGEQWAHWERPTTLEELIPADIRYKWQINSSTNLTFAKKRGAEGTDIELAQEIAIPDDDKKIRAFMIERNIKTTHQKDGNLQRIREWAIQRGCRFRILSAESI